MSRRLEKTRAIVISVFFAAVFLIWGCRTGDVDRHRMDKYRPAYEGRDPWVAQEEANEVKPSDMTGDKDSEEAPDKDAQSTRTLKSGARVMIYLRAIPEPEDLRDVIGENGNVNLPHIGKVNIGGMTASRAESFIEKKYIEDGIYNNITVILVVREYEYFVQGEVQRPGKYPLTGETTLSQAVAEAGGATDFGNLKRVDILRGREMLRFNLKRIEAGRQKNPIIEPGDVIKVRRGLW
ncbi:MAG: polysaccharide biosynthesis/export family protein [Verrucomicrobiota bacterium]